MTMKIGEINLFGRRNITDGQWCLWCAHVSFSQT